MIIQTNAHIGFVCKDLEKSIRFYETVLGLKEKFTLYYGDMIPESSEEQEKMTPECLENLRKVKDVKWIVYMEWMQGPAGYFIELFNELGAHIENLPSKEKFGINHIDIVVDDIQAYYKELIEKGAAEYIDILPNKAICRGYTMWIHDPDGNQIEIHQYTPESMQLIGR